MQAELISDSGAFTGIVSISEINSPDIHEVYTYNKQEQYIPVVRELAIKGNKITYSFPAHSFTQIRTKIE